MQRSFHRQNGPNSTNFKKKSESSNFYDYSRRLAENIEGFFLFKKALEFSL
jgi:hypothetical protein